MVKKGDGESPNIKKGGGNEPPSEGKGANGEKTERRDKGSNKGEDFAQHPWGALEADIKLTEELLSSGRAEKKTAIFGHTRLRRLDLGEPRRQYSWEAIGEVFSADVSRQTENMSCVNKIGSELSKGRFTEAELINIREFTPPAPMKGVAKYIGIEYDCVVEGAELATIAANCEKGPWGANLLDGEGIHAVIVQFKNEATGRLRIHDFYEGTKYEMTLSEFLRVWNGQCMFR